MGAWRSGWWASPPLHPSFSIAVCFTMITKAAVVLSSLMFWVGDVSVGAWCRSGFASPGLPRPRLRQHDEEQAVFAFQQSHRMASAISPNALARSLDRSALFAVTEKTDRSQSSARLANTKPQHLDFDAAKKLLLSKTLPDNLEGGKEGIVAGRYSDRAELAYLVSQYFSACSDAFLSGNHDVTPQRASLMIEKLLELGMRYGSDGDRYHFGVRHHAMRGCNAQDEEGGSFDFYAFACDFVRPLIDLNRSVVLGIDNARRAFRQIEEGDNVVFFANHQSELDTPIMSILLETVGFGDEASRITYVAGHKVTTDPLAIPFSMGQNLICVHSKKHIMSDPATVLAKKRQNYKALAEILRMLGKGRAALWVAPSGGRDRRSPASGEVLPARFDLDVVEKYRLMGSKSKTRTHYYPLSMVTFELCPPPDFLDSGVGETRNLHFKPVGIAIGEELEKVTGVKNRCMFAETVENAVFSGYSVVCEALEAKRQA